MPFLKGANLRKAKTFWNGGPRPFAKTRAVIYAISGMQPETTVVMPYARFLFGQ